MQLGFLTPRRALALFVVAGAAAGAISWLAGQSQNFDVFAVAARALLDGEDLYVRTAADYFKYSPTFALLFVPFTWGPSWLLAPLWSALNFGVVAWGLSRVYAGEPGGARKALLAQTAALAGIVVATDGDQSNLLVTGLALLAVAAFEEKRVHVAAQLVAAATLVKLFPLAFAGLALLLPRGPRARALAATVGALFTWTTLPLVVLSPEELAEKYASWHALLARDHGNHGWSVMSLLHDGLGLPWRTAPIQLVAIAVQAVPLALGARFGTDRAWRRTLACALLCFAVLFNHRAEYATFTVSAVALGIWYAERPTVARRVLLALAILAPGPFLTRANVDHSGAFAFLSAHRLFHPLRVLPLLVAWGAMQSELLARFVEVRVRVRALSGGREHAP